MSKRYFGGDSVKGHQHQLKASSWKEFVERYFNVPVIKQLTREEYDGLEDEVQKKIKDGHYVSACVFKEGTEARNDENAECLSCICLDIDHVDEELQELGYYDYATEFCESPEALKEALYPYNFISYETISSRPNRKSLRVVVDVEEMPKELHRAAVFHIAKNLLGITPKRWKGNKESKTLSLPMFRPVQFLDEEFSAVLCSRTSGGPLEELDIPNDVVTEESRSYGIEGEGYDSINSVPVGSLRVEDVREALFEVDPDTNYFNWCSVAMALKHQFREEEEAEEAYELFNEWSSGGSKYTTDDATYQKWRSFKSNTAGKAPVTIRSLFKMAMDSGWDNSKLSAKIKQSVSAWIANSEDPDELQIEGPDRIASLPFQNDLVEEALVVKLRDRVKFLTDTSIDKLTIKKAVKSARRKQRSEEREDEDLPPWLRNMVFIKTKNVFTNMATGLQYSPDAFNNAYSEQLMNTSPESDSQLTGRPDMLPVHFALNVKKSKRVEGLAYDPESGGGEPFFTHKGCEYLNLYRASSLPLEDPKNSAKAGKIFTHGVKTVVGEEHFQVMMDFCASAVQYPGRLIPWVPLIHSCPGAGKTLLFSRIMEGALGEDNARLAGPKTMLSGYNDWAMNCVWLCLEEIKIPGQNKAEVMNNFKDLITNDKISVERRYEHATVMRNLACKIAFTNHHDALYLEDEDRRWMPIKSPIQTKRRATELSREGYFVRLAKLLKYPGALRHFLLNWEISSDFPIHGPAPLTEFRDQMIDEAKNPLHVEIEGLIDNEDFPLIGSEVIHSNFLMTVLKSGMFSIRNNHKPSHFLHLLGYELYSGSKKFSINGVRTTIWVHKENYEEDLGEPAEILRERVDKEV